MRQYWRMQQSQAVVGLLLWGTTMPARVAYVRWHSASAAGALFQRLLRRHPATYAVAAIFLTVMLGVLTIGYLYDQVFSLWTEWRGVDMERNPYVYALTPNWMMITARKPKPCAAKPKGMKMQTQAEWFLKWCKPTPKGNVARAIRRWDQTSARRYGSPMMPPCGVQDLKFDDEDDKSSSSVDRIFLWDVLLAGAMSGKPANKRNGLLAGYDQRSVPRPNHQGARSRRPCRSGSHFTACASRLPSFTASFSSG